MAMQAEGWVCDSVPVEECGCAAALMEKVTVPLRRRRAGCAATRVRGSTEGVVGGGLAVMLPCNGVGFHSPFPPPTLREGQIRYFIFLLVSIRTPNCAQYEAVFCQNHFIEI